MTVQTKLAEKNFGLDEPTFQQMVEALKKGNNDIYERTFLAHFGDCIRYLRSTYKASHTDAYDATMETLLVFCNRLKAGKIRYGNLRFLYTKMASQIYLSWQKAEVKKAQLDGVDIPELPSERLEEEDRMILAKVWRQFGHPCKQLLQDFYYENLPSKKIAEKMGRSDAAVRKQKQRCVEKLRNLFKQQS